MAALFLIHPGLESARAGLLKASPAPLSDFVEHPDALAPNPGRAPFNRVWRNPSAQAWQRVRNFDRIAVLPVNVDYLRRRAGAFGPKNGPVEQGRPIPAFAGYMQTRFEKAFARGGVYQVVRSGGPRTLTLELALVELNPSNAAGNVIKTGADVFVPGAGLVGSAFTRGSVAIEGKLRNGETGEVLYEFADREQDKTSLISFRDYSPYAHSRAAVNDWAREIEQISRTPRNQKIRGASRVTLNPF